MNPHTIFPSQGRVEAPQWGEQAGAADRAAMHSIEHLTNRGHETFSCDHSKFILNLIELHR